MGQRSKSAISEHCHAAYQSKGNHECSNIVANILPADCHPLTLGFGSKGYYFTFSEYGHVAYQIKEGSQMQQHCSKYFARRHPYPGDVIKRSKINFFRTWSCCLSVKRNNEMQQHGHNMVEIVQLSLVLLN